MTRSTTLGREETRAVRVGDFFVSSWGYDQTNVDFYRVVGITPSGKSIRVQRWTSQVVRDNGPQVYVVPGDQPATYTDWSACDGTEDYWDREARKVTRDVPIETHRLTSGYGGQPWFTLNSYSGASLWDGEPECQTGLGWGH